MNSVKQLAAAVSMALVFLGATPGESHAAGTYKFCNFWQYSWFDEPGNQDYLSHTPGGVGKYSARYAWNNVVRNGVVISSGWSDSLGCLTTPAVAGDYIIRIFPAVFDGTKSFYMYSKPDQVWESFEGTGTLPGLASGTQEFSIIHASGTGIGNMAAVASNVIGRPSMGMKSGVNYLAYVDEPCPGNPELGSCYDPNTKALYLGTASNGVRHVRVKHVLGHELGHEIGANLAGTASNSGAYGSDGCTDGFINPDTCTLPQECQCNPHVVSSNGVHCLQSREFMNDAAQEGWGHFYATALYNDGSNPGSFTYYKEFYTYGGVIPAYILNYEVGTAPLLWLETYCLKDGVTTNRGVEADWQWFYYNMHRLQGANNYSLDNLASVYANSPGKGNSSWSQLAASAAATFAGAKGAAWQSVGDTQGVNH